MTIRIAILPLVLSIILPVFAVSQNKISLDKQIKCLEKQYFGCSELLVNGRPYIAINTKAEGHPYYLDKDYQKGTIFIKDRVFENVDIRYNLEIDQLILRSQLSNSTNVELLFTPSLLDSFNIHGHLFVSNDENIGIESGSNYLKRLYKGKISLYEERKKVYHPIFSEASPFGRYSKAEVTYFILDEYGQETEIKNKRAFLKYFGKHKRSIQRFMKKQSIRFRKATDEDFYILMKFCNELDL